MTKRTAVLCAVCSALVGCASAFSGGAPMASKAAGPSFGSAPVQQVQAQKPSDPYRYQGYRGAKAGKRRTQGIKAPPTPMVVYLGYLKLRVKRLLESIDQITKETEKAGGYIESLGARHVVVRIPASDFDAVMGRFAAFGDVLDKRVKSLDVTTQFTDLRARLSVAKEARDRLLTLLEQVKKVEERLKILQEIKRLSEQIESIESTLTTLQNLINFFTITIDLVPVIEREARAVHRSPFGWVQGLSAHRVTLEEGKEHVRMTLPRSFVLFDEDDVYRAQAADTSMLRAGMVPNEPKGDTEYWSDAIHHELDGRDEALIETVKQGKLKCRIYRNKDIRPRYYLVGVHADDERTYVVEVFFPNEEAYRAHKRAVLDALSSFEVK